MTEQEIKVAANFINYLLDTTVLLIEDIAKIVDCPVMLVEEIVYDRWEQLLANDDCFATAFYEAKELAKESK